MFFRLERLHPSFFPDFANWIRDFLKGLPEDLSEFRREGAPLNKPFGFSKSNLIGPLFLTGFSFVENLL